MAALSSIKGESCGLANTIHKGNRVLFQIRAAHEPLCALHESRMWAGPVHARVHSLCQGADECVPAERISSGNSS